MRSRVRAPYAACLLLPLFVFFVLIVLFATLHFTLYSQGIGTVHALGCEKKLFGLLVDRPRSCHTSDPFVWLAAAKDDADHRSIHASLGHFETAPFGLGGSPYLGTVEHRGKHARIE